MDTIKKNEFCILTSFLMKCFFVGISIHNITYITKQDSWISIIIAFIIGLIPLLLFNKLINLEPNLNINKLINKYFGNFFGNFLNLFLILSVTFHASIVLWNLSNFINSQFLFKTPILAISIFFMIPVIYTVNKGLKTIGRTGMVLFIINILFFLLSFLSVINKIDLSNLSPTLENGIFPILDGALVEFSYCALAYFLLLIIPKNNISQNKNLGKCLLKIYIYNFIVMFIFMFLILTVFGQRLANLYQYPEYHLLKTINVADFLQRVESVLSFQWLFDFCMSLIIFVYYIKTSLQQTLKLENKFDLLFIILISIIIIILSVTIFKDNTIAYDFLGKIYKYIRVFILFFIPLFIWIVVKVRKKS
jgi:spore germination protein KB